MALCGHLMHGMRGMRGISVKGIHVKGVFSGGVPSHTHYAANHSKLFSLRVASFSTSASALPVSSCASSSSSSSSWWKWARIASVTAVAAGLTVSSVALSESNERGSLQQVNSAAFQELSDLLGDRFSIDDGDRDSHGKDAYSYHGDVAPWAIVWPLSTEEVSEIAKICSKYRIPMIPYGSGTSLEGHTTAPDGGVTIDLSRMNNIKVIHVDDMDVVVEPGIPWGELNEELKPYGLFYPVDPGPGASIGGMCGTGCSGTNAVRYGTMRQNVLNLTVVLADGTILKTAQRARKSSAGYNLTGLFVGSEGTLGIITEATLRLQNLPENTAVAVTSFPTIHDAAAAAIAVQRKAEKPTIFFKFHGSKVGVADEIKQVGEIVKGFKGGEFQWAIEPAARDKIWEGRKGALWGTIAYIPENQVWTTDVCVPISRLADCIEAVKKDIEKSSILAPIVGHVGDGNFHVMLSVNPNDHSQLEQAKKINQRMDYLPHELGVTTVETMRRIKAALDPQGLMNPDKIMPPLHSRGHPDH